MTANYIEIRVDILILCAGLFLDNSARKSTPDASETLRRHFVSPCLASLDRITGRIRLRAALSAQIRSTSFRELRIRPIRYAK